MTTAPALVSARVVLVDATGRLTNDGLKILSRIESAILSPDGIAQVMFGTPWMAYIPVFTGFGTVTGIAVESRRIGDTLCIRGKFTPGTTTATESRMTLGYNGTSGNVTADATKVPSIQNAGFGSRATAATTLFDWRVLTEGGVNYVTFGHQTSTASSQNKQNGNAWIASGEPFWFSAEIPIAEWA